MKQLWLLALLVGCKKDTQKDFVRTPYDLADNGVTEGHPQYAGQNAFLYETWGVEVLDSWPPADFMLDLMDEPAFGDQFSAFGFLPDPGDEFPVGIKRGIDDPDRVNITCAICHVAELPDGRIWIGAPNTKLDYGAFQLAVDDAWVAAGNPSLQTPLERKKLALLGPGRTNAESGGYPQVVPADFPAYFDLGDRTALNYMGTGGTVRTEAYLSLFTIGVGKPNAEEAVVPWPEPDRIDPFIDFIGQLAPPDSPNKGSAAGEQVFEQARCGECHHVDNIGRDGVTTLDKDGIDRYPGDDQDYPRGSVATSSLHRVLQDGDGDGGLAFDEGLLDLINFIATNGLSVAQTDGYRVNTLRGLWATAPYLHNGSVPTLEALLQAPEDRPDTFKRDGFTIDTRQDGNSNQGHAFGSELSAADKKALVAYLESL